MSHSRFHVASLSSAGTGPAAAPKLIAMKQDKTIDPRANMRATIARARIED
jgi:hypothetical protein